VNLYRSVPFHPEIVFCPWKIYGITKIWWSWLSCPPLTYVFVHVDHHVFTLTREENKNESVLVRVFVVPNRLLWCREEALQLENWLFRKVTWEMKNTRRKKRKRKKRCPKNYGWKFCARRVPNLIFAEIQSQLYAWQLSLHHIMREAKQR